MAAVYVVFVIRPYSNNIARSLLKEPKVYFFDITLVESGAGSILENLVAVSLLKHVYACNDQRAQDLHLYYLRTKDGDEVDFAIAQKHDILQIIEVQTIDHHITHALYKFKKKYGFDSLQLVQYMKHEYCDNGISVINLERYLQELYL